MTGKELHRRLQRHRTRSSSAWNQLPDDERRAFDGLAEELTLDKQDAVAKVVERWEEIAKR